MGGELSNSQDVDSRDERVESEDDTVVCQEQEESKEQQVSVAGIEHLGWTIKQTVDHFFPSAESVVC